MNKAIFLDRDGVVNLPVVINNKPYPPRNVFGTQIMPNIANILSWTNKMGYLNIIVTNQPDISRGTQSEDNVIAINKYLYDNIPIDDIYVCIHDDKDGCFCRKPKSGLLHWAGIEHNIDLKLSWMIGDRKSDIIAGISAGCKTIFIDYNYNEIKPIDANYIIKDISELWDIL